ncbi:TackOD1 domain-containing metal-binding protein [Haladaptatus sp. NG-SE-30]
MTDLRDDSLDGIHPTLDIETGQVTYPEATARLDERDGSAFEVLETLAKQDRLYREFQEKQYICPQCETKGMQYTSACPSCASPQTIRTERYRHGECGHEGTQEQFLDDDGDDGIICPECEMSLESLGYLSSDPVHVCEKCDRIFDKADHRLRCRNCHLVAHPRRTTERILYQYYLTDQGVRWVEEQLTAREAAVKTLESRTLQTQIDTTVPNSSGEDVPVHIYAQDELLDDHIVAAVHELPDESDITKLLTIALDVDARALLITTSGNVVGEEIEQLVSDDRLTILRSTKDGALQRGFEIISDPTARNSFVGRIANIFKPQTG